MRKSFAKKMIGKPISWFYLNDKTHIRHIQRYKEE